MSRTPDKQDLVEHFAEEYRLAQSPIMREVERAVLGCDYGATSWPAPGGQGCFWRTRRTVM
jgi:hypothetical protein